MFKESKKFFGPQLTQDLRSGIFMPEGMAVAVNSNQNFAFSFGVVGDVMLKDGEQIPLFANPLDIATDAQNATTVPQVVSIATSSLVNNQQLNRCEQPLPFEPLLYGAAFRRATTNSANVTDAIQACVSEVDKIYIPILIDSNRRIFEVDGIATRDFPLGDYFYQDQFNLSMKKGVIYAASVNDETLSPITVSIDGIYAVTISSSGDNLAILSNNEIRYFTRAYEKPFTSASAPFAMTIPLAGGTYQSIVQKTTSPFTPLFVCNTSTKKIVEISTAAGTVGNVLSNSSIDTIADNNLPIIGIVGLVPNVMDVSGANSNLVIAEQNENAIVAMAQGGSILNGWTYFPHPVLGICRDNVAVGTTNTNTDLTILYENPLGADQPNLASKVKFSETTASTTLINAVAGGVWSFLSTGVQFSFSPTISGFATQAGGGLETRTAILFDTSGLNDSRMTVLKARLVRGSGSTVIPFSIDLNTGELLPATVQVYAFTTATPGVVVNGDLATGIGALLGSFLIPYTNQTNTGVSHPPPDPDGVVRGDWAFELPLANLNTTGYTGLYVQLTGFNPLGSHNIAGGISSTLKLIVTLSNDISSNTPTTFLSNFPADGTFRYEERIFSAYMLDKQQEFQVPVENVKQICTLQRSRNTLDTKPKVRTYNVEFPRLAYTNNSVAKTTNGSTYVTNSYSSPKLTSGYAMKVGEFYDSRSGTTLTTKTKRLILTFDRLQYWFHSMRLTDGLCKLQLHIQSYTSRLIDNSGAIRVISNPNKFSLLTYISGTNPENGIKIINGGAVFKSLTRNMALDTDGDGIVTEADLGRNYIVEFDVTDSIVALRKTQFSSAGFIFRNENENQFFTLANGNNTIVGGEISSSVEIFDELAPRLLFTDTTGELFKKNGYKSASMPHLTPSIVI